MSFTNLFKIRRDDDQVPIPIALLMMLFFAVFVFKMFDG